MRTPHLPADHDDDPEVLALPTDEDVALPANDDDAPQLQVELPTDDGVALPSDADEDPPVNPVPAFLDGPLPG